MITHIVYHWVLPDQIERAKELFEANGRVIREIPGFVSRQILRSQSDPLKWAAANTWQDEGSLQRWMEHPDHILDAFGRTLTGPADSEYVKKYANAGHFDSRPAESDRFEVVASHPPRLA